MTPIRILHVNGGLMDRGGISTFLMNYYRHVNRRRVQFDFVVHGCDIGALDNEITQLGGVIYHVPVKSKDPVGNMLALRKILRSGNYRIVHAHMDAMNAVVLREAKAARIPVRIAHSHNTQHLVTNWRGRLLNDAAKRMVPHYATHLFACSEPAARWLFGDRKVNAGSVVLVRNAVDLERFSYSPLTGRRVRSELSLGNSFVLGHVGRFDHQKNHAFLLDIFAELLKAMPESRLVLIGDGHLRGSIEAKIGSLGIQEKVHLLGERSDVSDLMNALDVFVLPSLFEGLGISAIEAQANGMTCLLSSAVPSEVAITDRVTFLSIADKRQWSEAIARSVPSDRAIELAKFAAAGYDIHIAARRLEETYAELAATAEGRNAW